MYQTGTTANNQSEGDTVRYSYDLRHHYRPAQGWMNDPNGLVYFNGYYHAFYQHAPGHEQPWHESMAWGHARTKDFISWEELPVALWPDQPYDCGGCWSGTAIVHEGRLYLFYASVVSVDGQNRQNVSMAWSDDGVTFVKSPANPIIPDYPADGSPDFRDPAVMRDGDKFFLVMASGSPANNAARLLLYESENLTDWAYSGVLYEWRGGDDVKMRYCECPSFMKYGDRYLLTASVVEEHRHYFIALYGDMEGGRFVPEVSGSVHLGPDQYAGQVFLDERGRHIMITWVPGWHYSTFADRSLGCLSLPIELVVRNGRLYGVPLDEVRHLLTPDNPHVERTDGGFVIRREQRENVVYEGEIRELAVLQDEYLIEVWINGGENIVCAVLC